MTQKDKIEKIQGLSEDELRRNLLMPLFSKMGYIDPILHHHAGEKGKDIVLKEYDQKFKKTYYLAAVVKAGDVTGSASGSNGYFAVLNQVRQCLNEPYKHIYELREVNIDKVLIVISGRFLPTALESILGTLKSDKLDRSILDPMDVNKLLALIDEFFIDYWDEEKSKISSLTSQRNQLQNNLSKLISIVLPSEQLDTFLGKAAVSEIKLDVAHYQSMAKYVASIGYYQLNIDEIDAFYTDKRISNEYADIKEHFFEVKRKTMEVLYKVDEVVSILKEILLSTDPQRMVELSYKLNDYIGGYGRREISFSSNDIEWQEEFDYALKEYRDKKSLLVNLDIQKLYADCYDALSVETVQHLIVFFQQSTNRDTNKWLGVKVRIDRSDKTFSLEHYEHLAEPEIIDKKKIIEFETFQNDEIDLRYALANYGAWREDITPEKKAKGFVWLFERGFESMFLAMMGYEKP